ncbi:response regulator [Bradyrhizobium manausense]|uniref:response regulator n=1 Tax=Bradyrhizobium TaxID=374 RepID=UPI001BAA44D8|nr:MULTISPECIES: response regulator [Bradyrhizobium]MBR0826816.1 response regulator [Bradyrhizobium manausense]UVO32101.1 response regulator [Bradyrhizobium arachidis]
MPRILVVDDQKDVRAMVSIVLRVNRYEVVEADSAAAGLKAFDESAFDAAIVDIFLAETSGVEVITTIRERSPGFPIVAISGMTALDFMDQSPDLENVVCLQKPFRPNDLLQALKSAQSSRFQAAV